MKAVLVAVALVLAVSVQAQKPASAGDKIFDLTRVHRLHVSISAAEWAVLMTSGGRSTIGPGGSDYKLEDGRLVHLSSGFANTFPWAHADLRVDDADGKAAFKNVGIRYKGNSSFTRSSIQAPLLANFKLKIDLHGAKGTWDGERTFNLQSGVVDTSRMRDSLAYWIFRRAGVTAPRTTYAEIVFSVPGVYQDASAGLFTIIEDVNQKLLERALPPGTGLLMKPEQLGGGIRSLGSTWAQYTPKLRPDREATAHEQERVMGLSELVSQSDTELFRAKIGTYLDVESFLRFVAVNAFITNWDSYLTGGHNFYLYLDPSDDKFRFIPWDQDLSLSARGGFVQLVRAEGTVVNGAVTVINGVNFTTRVGAPTGLPGTDMMNPANSGQLLISKLLGDPAVNARYREIIRELASTAFSSAELTKVMDALEAVTKVNGAVSPREFVLSRANVIQQLVGGWEK